MLLLAFALKSAFRRSRLSVRFASTAEFDVPSNGWSEALSAETESERFYHLQRSIEYRRSKNVVYPPPSQTLRALREVDFDDVKVVILGQDPYHRPGQADGLAFSSTGSTLPKSLKNVLKVVSRDISGGSLKYDESKGDLSGWAEQGVLLLNTLLTVEEGKPMSHDGCGWQDFTDAIVSSVIDRGKVVFLCWGRRACEKVTNLAGNEVKDDVVVLQTSHPSPLSAYRGFMNCSHFSRANEILKYRFGVEPIDWTCDGRLLNENFDENKVNLIRFDIACPFGEKNVAKGKGALWDPDKKTWYVSVPAEREKEAREIFSHWLP